MSSELKLKTERFRLDFHKVSGKVFTNFFCPILFTDETVPLCKGHIVNKAFANSSAWTVQRQDVDSFFGSSFESDFVALQYRGEAILQKSITDKNIFNKTSPKLLLDNKPIDFFIAQESIPIEFTKLILDDGDRAVTLGLKIRPDEVLEKIDHKWEIEISKDIRISALVSLIKSAHLSLFELIGYNYALSTSGYFVGKIVLGDFFIQNRGKPKSEVIKNAFPYFKEFTHMVRPVVSLEVPLEGTIYDGTLLLCLTENDDYWAFLVFVKIAKSLHAVLIPVFDKPETVETFMNFLSNSQDTINVRVCRFEKNRWEIDKSIRTIAWPKDGTLYPEKLDNK